MIERWTLRRGADSARVRASLARALGITWNGPDDLLIGWVDTFDGRLAQRGFELRRELAPNADQASWRFEDAAQGELLAKGQGPREIAAVEDLPESPLRDRLRPLLAPRRLFEAGAYRVLRWRAEWRDGEGKLCAVLTLETEQEASEPAVDSLSAYALRGFEVSSRPVFAALAADQDLQPDRSSPRQRQGQRAGFVPASTAAAIALHPSERAHSAVRRVLSHYAATMERHEPGVLADWDMEFLHDWRVALRRTRSFLADLKSVFVPGVLEPSRALLRELGQVSSPARDADVWLEGYPSSLELLPPTLARALAPLEALLRTRKVAAHRALVRALETPRIATQRAQWRAFLADDALPPLAAAKDGHAPIREVAARRTRRRLKALLAEGAAIDDHSPAVHLHELRKTGKRLRYLLEAFAQVLSEAEARAAIKALKGLQDVLGDVQDLEVQRDALMGFGQELGASEDLALASALAALKADALRRQREAREAFSGAFEAFRRSEAVAELIESLRLAEKGS